MRGDEARARAARRAAAVAGHRGDEATARAAQSHPVPAVRAAALGALSRTGSIGDEDLAAGLSDPSPEVRRRACDLAGRLRRSGLAGALVAALSDTAPRVVEAACYALGELNELPAVVPTAVAALSSTARSHPEPLCREAAVAALGALGAPAGLPAVLAALEDKPAVRRRAAVALAAFEGPAAEAGLARAARDRDWQVRQVAMDLLGEPFSS